MTYLDNHDVQFELSNPQYFPDDSAPPVPNISVSTIGESGTIKSDDHISLYEGKAPHPGFQNPNDIIHFHGVPTTRATDSISGVTKTTGDHILWSHLNVESSVPSFTLYNEDSKETYFSEFLPAAAGVYNFNGSGAGVPIVYVHAAQNIANSFAIYGGSGTFLPEGFTGQSSIHEQKVFETRYISSGASLVNNYEILDFYVRIKKEGVMGAENGSRIDVFLAGYELTFVSKLQADGRLLFYVYAWKVDRESGDVISQGIVTSHYLTSTPQLIAEHGNFINLVVRFELHKGSGDIGQVYATADGERFYQIVLPDAYTPTWDNTSVELRAVFATWGLGLGDSETEYSLPMSVQIVGYVSRNEVLSAQEAVLGVYPSPYEFYYPLSGHVSYDYAESMYPLIVPKHKGNLWDYANKVATMFPYRRMVN